MNNPFPTLPKVERDALKADIAKRGVIYPIVRDQTGQVIDGHQRDSIARELGITAPEVVIPILTHEEREEISLALNIFRRHLGGKARDHAITKLLALGYTQATVAKLVGVSHQTVGRAGKAANVQVDNKAAQTAIASGKRQRAPGAGRKPAPVPPPAPEPEPEPDAVPGVSPDTIRYEVTALIDSIRGKGPLNQSERDRLTAVL